MNHKRFLIKISNILLVLLLLAACSAPASPTPVSPTSIAPTATASPADEATILQIVRDAGKVEPDRRKDEKKIIDQKVSEDGKTRYIYEKHDVVDTIDNVMYLGMNDDIIWPGSLVRGDRVNDFVYEPIAVARGPVTLSLSLESSMGTGPSITEQVDNPKLSTVRQGISDLLKKAVTKETRAPAKVEFNYQRVYEEDQMKLVLGTDVKYGAGKVNANFNWDSTAKKTKILARYRQIYYSIDIDPPLSGADLFAPSMTAPRLTAMLPPGSKPMYIAGVSYGMMALMFIETDASEENIKAALEAEYSGGADVKINGEVTAKNILENSSIKILVYGGSTAHLKNLETGYEGFKNVIEASSDFGPDSPGVPLLYKFRHLSDNTLALTTLTSQYTITRPIQILQDVRVTLVNITCTSNNNDWFFGKNKFQKIQIGYNAYNAKKGGVTEVIDEATKKKITIGNGNAIELYSTNDNIEWRPEAGESYKKSDLSFPIRFNTDPESYDSGRAYVTFRGYTKTDWKYAPRDVNGEMTVYFPDFLIGGGEHILYLNGSDGTLAIKFKIELVE